MATAAETPRTATVARMRVRALEKRYELRKSLLARFAYRFGSDTKRVALIEAELSKWPQLEQGQPLSRADLAALEQAVQAAVARAVHAKSIPPIESYSEDLGAVANWNCLAEHQARSVGEEKLKEQAGEARRKEALASIARHERFELEQRRRAAKEAKTQELSLMRELQARYKHEQEAAEEERKAKMERVLQDQRAQVEERKARRAVESRLRSLEDDEFRRQLKDEAEQAARAKARKAVEDRLANQAAVAAGQAGIERRRVQKREEDALTQAKNAEWKALLDKQEADRAEAYRQRKMRIDAMQRGYESSAGAAMRAREEAEAARRQRDLEQAEAEAAAEEARRKAKLKDDTASMLKALDGQMEARERRKREERVEDERRARKQREETAAFKQEEERQRQEARARAMRQQQLLAEQVEERRLARMREQDMTPLEQSLNRGLLLSVLEEKKRGR